VPVSSILQPFAFLDIFYDFIHEDEKTDACLSRARFWISSGISSMGMRN
jgi:hypothetical protein